MLHIRTSATLFLLSWWASGCEAVLGTLPTPCEERGTCTGSGTSSTGGEAGSGASTSTGGTGATGSGGTGGLGGGGSTATTGGTGGTGGSTTSTTSSDPCDMDGDSKLALSCADGTDCDDNNDKIPALETQYFTVADPVVGFDYDCSGFPELDPKHDVGIKCNELVLKSQCENAAPGYLDNAIPSCGQPGAWGACQWASGLGPCENKPISPMEIMPCH